FFSSSVGGSMMVRGLGTVIYHVAGLHRAKTWYTQAFQQQPYFDEPFYIGFNIGGCELGVDPDFTLNKPGLPRGSTDRCRSPQRLETRASHCRPISIMLHKNPLIASLHFRSDPTTCTCRAVMVRRTGKGYVL